MPIDSERFLERYAEALNTFNYKNIAGFYSTPSVIMDDKGKTVLNSLEDIEQALVNVFGKIAKSGISKFVPQVQQTMRLSDTLFFSKMRWQFYDQDGEYQFSCATSYTLQKSADEQLKIIVAVIDDDEKKLSAILKASE